MRKKQTANRNVVKGLIVKAKEVMRLERDATAVGQVAAYLNTIRQKEKLLADITDKICDLAEEDEICGTIEEAANFEESIMTDLQT